MNSIDRMILKILESGVACFYKFFLVKFRDNVTVWVLSGGLYVLLY